MAYAVADTTVAGENKRKHLEFIQNAIDRMARNSFLIKGWTILLFAAFMAFLGTGNISYINAAQFIALVAAGCFWGLDGYFLWQERLFRRLYDHVRILNEEVIDYSMDTNGFREAENWKSAVLSKTLFLFYGPFYALMIIISVASIFAGLPGSLG